MCRARFDNDDARFAHGDDPKLAALFAEMRRRGTILDATVSIHASFERSVQQHPNRKIYLCSSKLALQLTNQAQCAGVEISTGTDEVAPASDPFPQLYAELTELASGAGMSAAAVLRSATVVGARAVGHERDMGTLETGKLANFNNNTSAAARARHSYPCDGMECASRPPVAVRHAVPEIACLKGSKGVRKQAWGS